MKPPKIIGVSYSVSLHEVKKNISFMGPQIIDKIHRQIAVELHDEFIKETDDEYIRTYEFRAYVVTPSELEAMIQEGVQKKRMSGYPTGIMY